MQRVVASLPDSVEELCLVRLGLQVHRLSAFPYAVGLGRAIEREAAEAMAAGAGLLRSERFSMGWRHFGVLQYWRSFDDLEAWSHRSPHAEWWRKAVERGRTRKDFGVYHEAFLVPRGQLESIYLGCRPTGLAGFGIVADAVGPMTTSRDRLRRRREATA
jgi:heme-degrading monooxygenase HmoA